MVIRSDNVDQTLDSRRGAVREFKKGLIRDAAKRIFAERGIESASMREIAQSAGYTTGAIYTYFATKEELYAEVLRDSLRSVHRAVLDATNASGRSRTESALRCLWAFYNEHPADFGLGFYLYGGVRPAGLSKQLDNELNALFDQVMDLIGDSLVADHLVARSQAHHMAVVHVTWIFGLLLMAKTGRVRSVGEDAAAMLDSYVQIVSRPKTE